MNKDRLEGNYEQLKGKIKETWADLTDDEIGLYEAKQDQFYGKLKEKYGIAKEEAEKKIKKLCNASADCQTDKAA